MKDEDLERIALAWQTEFERWGTRLGPVGLSEITRDGIAVATAVNMHESRAKMGRLRRLASAKAVATVGGPRVKPLRPSRYDFTGKNSLSEILAMLDEQARKEGAGAQRLEISTEHGRAASAIRQLIRQRDKLLPILVHRYRDIPSPFLDEIVAGRKQSSDISLDVALAIIAVRNIYDLTLTEA